MDPIISPGDEKATEYVHDGDTTSNEHSRPASGGQQEGKAIPSDSQKIEDPEKGDATTANAAADVPIDPSPKDPNIVDWDGPDDPENPMNWPNRLKYINVGILSFATFLTPLASSFFAPGVPELMKEFHSTSVELATFVVSVYVLGFAIGPLVVAPLSEMYGRRPLYVICNFFFVVLSVACAVSSNLGMLIAFRLLQGCAGSAPLTIGGGSIADMIPPEGRGRAMAAWSMGPLFGPVVGPVCGGFLVGAKGWRWVFWVLVILGGLSFLGCLLYARESYGPVLLDNKAARLRKSTGNPHLRSALDTGLSRRDRFSRAIVRPTKMLFLSPTVAGLALLLSVHYGLLYLMFTTFTFQFESIYHFSPSIVGLSFLGIGVGLLVGLVVVGVLSDRAVKAAQAKGETPTPELRMPLRLTIPAGICIPIGLFIYGWTAEYKVHWIVPIIGTGITGLGLISMFMCVMTYLIDAFTLHAASALAANTVLRSLAGALLPLAGLKMYDELGQGWGNSVLAFIALAVVPVPAVFGLYGARIRESRRFQVTF